MSSTDNTSGPNLLKKWYPYTTAPFIANAPMYGYTDANMAASVTKAGGYGFLACGYDFTATSPQLTTLETSLLSARALLSLTDSPNAPLPIGCGFLSFSPAGFSEHVIPLLRKHRVSGIWLAFPRRGAYHGPMISAIRAAVSTSAAAAAVEEQEPPWDVKIWVQVGDLASAREALLQGADVLVVQGVDAGGHQWASGVGIVALVPEVRNLVDDMGRAGEVAVVAAGGVVDGRGVVAAMSLGAEGVVMGTRFLCTTECPAPASMKQVLVSTTDGAKSTVKSNIPDLIQNYGFWEPTYNGRSIIGPAYQDYLNGVPIDELIETRKQAIAEGNKERSAIIWAGAGVGNIKEILSVDTVVKQTQSVAKQVIRKLGGLVSAL